MPFPPAVRQEVLLRSKRHCCVCQEFAGREINVHHIEQEAHGGRNDISNAIALCLRCHGEAGHFNAQHPIGTKYSPEELRRHRDAWWVWCAQNPAAIPPKSPIRIAPSCVALAHSEWDHEVSVSVSNQAERPLFQIWVKIVFIGSPKWRDHVQIKPLVDPKFKQVKGISTQLIVLSGMDAAGDACSLYRIHHLRHGEMMWFDVRVNASRAGDLPDGELRLSMLDFSEEPPHYFEHGEGNKVATEVIPPEAILVQAVGIVPLEYRRD